MTILLAFTYLISIAFFAWKRPMWSVALTANAFIFNAALGFKSGLLFTIVGLGGPLLCYLCIVLFGFLKKRAKMRFDFDLFFLFVLFLVMLSSGLYADSPILSIEISIRYLVFCYSFFLIARFIMLNQFNRNQAIIDYCLATFTVGLIATLFALFKQDSSSEYFMRLTIGDVSSIPLSLLIAQSIIIALYFCIYNKNKSRYLFIIALPILLYGLMLTNTRSTMISVFLCAILLLALGYNLLNKVQYFRFFVFSFFVIPILLYFAGIDETLYQRSFLGFERLVTGELGESEGDRLLAWYYALSAFSENILFGIGTGNFGQMYIAYPHNVFLELLSENGLFGFVPFFIVIFLGVKRVLGNLSQELILVYVLFIFSLFVAQVSLTMWMHKSMFIWLAILLTSSIAKTKTFNKIENNV